jgi:hydrogenase nickel incorporation protein HypA/HybF
MHELSIAESLVELISDEVALHDSARVVSVRLRLGPLSGVVLQALRFAYGAATAGTALEGSSLEIDEVKAAVYCPRCRTDRDLDEVRRLRCPVCDTPSPRLVRGRELEVVSVCVSDSLTIRT